MKTTKFIHAAEYGDRELEINLMYPRDAFYHNGKGGRIIDVTKEPFNAKGDGVTDDTAALISAMRFVREHYDTPREKEFSYCGQKLNRNWIIYFPEGEYLVSDTVCQGWPALAMNILNDWSHVEYFYVESPEHEQELCKKTERANPPSLHGKPELTADDNNHGVYIKGQYANAEVYDECNWAIRLMGQNREKTIIRLKDGSKGFDVEAGKAVVSFCMLQRGSNINIGNVIENITINTGKGNSRAIGLKWNSSNFGAIRNVKIQSSDGAGRSGILMDTCNATGQCHDILIDGFEVGLEMAAGRESVVCLEYASFIEQRKMAIRVGGNKSGGGGDFLTARKLKIVDAPIAFTATQSGQVIVQESEITSTEKYSAALEVESGGFLAARNVHLCGYGSAVIHDGKTDLRGDFIADYSSTKVVKIDGKVKNIGCMEAKDFPVILPEQNVSQWASVDDYGAFGNGVVDDTEAIQSAMNSGKSVVYFPKAEYVVNGTVRIPASVKEVTFMLGSVHRSIAQEWDSSALFQVSEASSEPLKIHQAYVAGGVFLDHSETRPLVLQDINICFHHCRDYPLFSSSIAKSTSTWRLYRNVRPDGTTKEVFVNDSLFFAAGEKGMHSVENANVWARMLNNEHLSGAQFSFTNSRAWILGFKAEDGETLLFADSNSRVEVWGGNFLNWNSSEGPVIRSRNSSVKAIFLAWHWKKIAKNIMHSEKKNRIIKIIYSDNIEKINNTDSGIISVCNRG